MESFDLFYKKGDNIKIIRMRHKDSFCLGLRTLDEQVGAFISMSDDYRISNIPIPADVEAIIINDKEFKRQFFKPGDIVVGNTKHRYRVTTLGFIGKVVKSFGDNDGRFHFSGHDILIKDLVNNADEWIVCSMFFRHATPEEIEKIPKLRF